MQKDDGLGVVNCPQLSNHSSSGSSSSGILLWEGRDPWNGDSGFNLACMIGMEIYVMKIQTCA